MIPELDPPDTTTRWFSHDGCVVPGPEVTEVFIGGLLVGRFGPREVGARNVLLVTLAQDRKLKKGKLAEAFGLRAERLRRLCRHVGAEGIDAIPVRARGGRVSKVTAPLRRRLERLFEAGYNPHQAYRSLCPKRARGGKPVLSLSYPTVRTVHARWKERQDLAARANGAEPAPQQQALPLSSESLVTMDASREMAEAPSAAPSEAPPPAAELAEAEGLEGSPVERVQGVAVRSGRLVQHAGAWLLLATVQAMGLYAAIEQQWVASAAWKRRLRVVIDLVVMALGLGQRCVEGVRRLETPSGPMLLRADRVPSCSWVRRVLKRYVAEASALMAQLTMTQLYLARSRAESQGAVVLYLDNHMRPYTGKQTVRRGWRMQDKRVRPGATDFYVHDEDGRPLFRWESPENAALTQWLSPVLTMIRASLGEEPRILVAFDRAGAYPAQLAELREQRYEFVTYERRPYPLLSETAFSEELRVGDEVYGLHESRLKNLGKGRGRVRRLALRTPEGRQVNLLASSSEPAARLVEVMLGRWVQENGFKHGVQRWGINQLDRRAVEPYPPQCMVPNPARRRLETALKVARQREGEARRQLARLEAAHPRRAKVEWDLEQALGQQAELEAQRPQVPPRAPLGETELKGKLVYHPAGYKTLIDTIRIACANAESELAALLGPHLPKPAEAKKALANLFAAPGEVRVQPSAITVTLNAAGTAHEQVAYAALLEQINEWRLPLPGDPKRRPLRFRSHLP
jgi:hypothetical protein